jgi:hypothetical protein
MKYFRISFRIRGDICEYVLIIRYAGNSVLCRIAHQHDIAQNSDYALCRIADDKHIFANISAISKRYSKIF